MANIVYADCYLPSNYESIDEVLAQATSFSPPDQFQSLEDYCRSFRLETNLEKIFIEQEPDEMAILCDLVDDFFSKTNYKPTNVDFLIYQDIHNTWSINSPISTPHYIQHKFGMFNASVFTINQACASSILSLGLAKNDNEKNGLTLILTTNFIPTYDERVFPYTIVGDGAGIAAVARSESGLNILDFSSVSNGLFSYNTLHNLPIPSDRSEIVKGGVRLIEDILARNNLSVNDLEMFVPQNLNHHVYAKIYADLLGIAANKIHLSNIPHGGHIGNVDIIRNLQEFLAVAPPLDNDRFILAYGLGGSASHTICAALLLKGSAVA